MKSRRSIEHAVKHAEERRVAEESVASRITLDDEQYFAKQWRGKHGEGSGENAYYVADSERTSVSPFWVKVKYWEHNLMHEAFPDEIVAMPEAYDPRISKDGKTFDFEHGRPVSLTRAVKTTEELQKKRDAIVDEIYTDLEAKEKRGERDLVKMEYDPNAKAGFVIAHEMDEAMRDTFGKDLGIRQLVTTSSFCNPRNRETFVEKVNRRFPNTRMADLVNAGILPIHAEANWIPTGEADERGVKGTLIEAQIFDPLRLREKLIEKKMEQMGDKANRESIEDRVDDKIWRYRFLRKLDEIYDNAFMSKEKYRTEGPHLDPKIRQTVFRFLDRVRERRDREKIYFNDDFFHHLQTLITAMTFNDEELVKEVAKKAEDWIENWKPPKKSWAAK